MLDHIMASANINCPLLDLNPDRRGPYNFPATAAHIMATGRPLLDLQPLPIHDPAFATQELSINVYNDAQPTNSTPPSHMTTFSKLYGVNENLLWGNENLAHLQFNMTLPEEELTVNIDDGESGTHSWRPNLTDSLTSDIFVAPSGLDNGYQIKQTPPQLFLWDSPIGEEPTSGETSSEKSDAADDGSPEYPRIDLPNHLQTQRTQLNCLKYEVINAKRRLHETRAVVAKLSCELEEKLLFKNSKEMKTLRDENSELRLECQCLCTEVDFYLRGKAPLGEIDESFLESLTEDTKADTASTSTPQATTEPQMTAEQQLYNSEEQEEADKWECRLCTFANHPAISSCEMCHLARNREETTPLHSTDICFCHPKQESDCS